MANWNYADSFWNCNGTACKTYFLDFKCLFKFIQEKMLMLLLPNKNWCLHQFK